MTLKFSNSTQAASRKSLRHQIAGIYVITDEQLTPGRTHLEIARAAISGGARIIQLRDKTADDSRLIEVGSEIVRFTTRAGALFIVNDRVEVAIACGADGVHIGQEDQPIQEVRKLFPRGIIGVSVSTIEEALAAEEAGADYIGVGSIFSTSTKSDAGPPIGIEGLAAIRKVCKIPIVAIGGISLENIREIARAGADSAAVISAVVCAEDMKAATAALIAEFQSGLR